MTLEREKRKRERERERERERDKNKSNRCKTIVPSDSLFSRGVRREAGHEIITSVSIPGVSYPSSLRARLSSVIHRSGRSAGFGTALCDYVTSRNISFPPMNTCGKRSAHIENVSRTFHDCTRREFHV